jgi:hypothetical protein
MALEVQIVLAEDLVLSFDTEFIENSADESRHQKKNNAQQIKKDFETKAFKRLVTRMKKDFPRLPILLLCDSLFVGEAFLISVKRVVGIISYALKQEVLKVLWMNIKQIQKKDMERPKRQNL